MGISFLKKIKLANKVINAYKRISEIVESKHSNAEELKRILDNLEADFKALLTQLPWLKDTYDEVKDTLN